MLRAGVGADDSSGREMSDAPKMRFMSSSKLSPNSCLSLLQLLGSSCEDTLQSEGEEGHIIYIHGGLRLRSCTNPESSSVSYAEYIVFR